MILLILGVNLQPHFGQVLTHNNITGMKVKQLTYAEWLFTDKPQIFGLMPGWGNPTGMGLLLVMILMGLGAMPWIRQKGHFEARK